MRRLKLWKVALCVPAAVLLAAAGCGEAPVADNGGTPPPAHTAAPSAAAETTPAKPVARAASPAPVVEKPADGTATIVGRVQYNGDPPKRRQINFGPEKKCCDAHTTPPLDDSLVVSGDRAVQWVMVRLASKVPGTFSPPAEPAVLDQKGCIFTPHILAVQAGQTIEIKNSDEVLHNVRCEAVLNPPFNRNLPKPGDAMTVKFEAPEVGMKLKCDVHFWMGGYIHVVPHPFFAVTGEDGTFTIAKVPPGTHKFEAWHEKLGKLTQEVTVKDGETKTIEFVFQPK